MGQVRSSMRGYLHLLKLCPVVSGIPPKFRGHLEVHLCKNGNGSFSRFRVHHLVLEAFIGPRPSGYECNHKNNIKSDNRPKNLEWVTHAENMAHAARMNLMSFPGEACGHAKLRNNEVWLMKKLLIHKIKRKIICKIFKVKKSYVDDVALERTWSCIKMQEEIEI